MSRAYLIATLTTVFVVAFALAPTSPASQLLSGFSNVAHAINLNTSRSNVNRMGGGPGKKSGSNRMGGGPGKSTGTTNKAINLNSSRSNTP
jgi:hypothetical protein